MTVLRFPNRCVVEPEPNVGTTEPDLGTRMGRGDLRHATLARCLSCLYQWYAPAIVRCPRCQSKDAKHLLSQELDYTRC